MAVSPEQADIKAPLFGYSFSTHDINSVTFVNELPGGKRINGAATNKYPPGNFDLAGYGAGKSYVYKGSPEQRVNRGSY